MHLVDDHPHGHSGSADPHGQLSAATAVGSERVLVVSLAELGPAMAMSDEHAVGTHLRLSAGARWLLVVVAAREDAGAVGGQRLLVDAATAARHGIDDGDEVRVQPVQLPYVESVTLLPLFDDAMVDIDRGALAARLSTARLPLVLGTRLGLPTMAGSVAPFEVIEVEDNGVGVLRTGGSCELVPAAEAAAWPAEVPPLDELPGMREEAERLARLLRMPLLEPWRYRRLGIQAPKGLVLYGPPGSGKTFLARAAARSLGIHCEFVSGSELVYGGRGESEANLRGVFGRAARHAPALVVVDELDGVVPNRARADSQADYRLVAQFLSLLDGLQQTSGVVLVGTTNLIDAIDPALRRPGRLDLELHVGVPSSEDRLEILSWYGRQMPMSGAARHQLPVLAERTWGYLPADLMAVRRGAALSALSRSGDADAWSDESISVDDLRVAEAAVKPSLLRGLDTVDAPAAELAELGLDEARLRAVRGLVDRARNGPAGIRALVEDDTELGPRLIEAVAGQLGQRVIWASPGSFVSQWFGETEARISAFFDVARSVAPVTVGIRHLDGLTARTGAASDAGQERIVAQLLHELATPTAGLQVLATVTAAAGVERRLAGKFEVV